MTGGVEPAGSDIAGGPATPARTPVRPLWVRAIGRLSDACGVLSATMILAAVLLTCQMIWVRYVANASTVWQTELVIYLMIAATLIGLPWVQRVRGHVNVDLLPRLLPARARRGLAVLTLVAAIAVLGAMLWHAAELWHLAWDRGWKSDTVWGPPLWIPYLALPLGLALYVLQLAADLAGVISGADEPFATAGDVTAAHALRMAAADTAAGGGAAVTVPGEPPVPPRRGA